MLTANLIGWVLTALALSAFIAVLAIAIVLGCFWWLMS
jgi:hypothetical protein